MEFLSSEENINNFTPQIFVNLEACYCISDGINFGSVWSFVAEAQCKIYTIVSRASP